MLNKVILVGRVANNLNIRLSKTGKEFVYFNLAINSGANNPAVFIPCVAWEKTAMAMSNNIAKGSLILVEGRLQVRKSKEEGQTFAQTIMEVYASNVRFLEWKKRDNTSQANTNNYAPTDNNNSNVIENFNFDDLSFKAVDTSGADNIRDVNLSLDNDDGISWEGE